MLTNLIPYKDYNIITKIVIEKYTLHILHIQLDNTMD